MIDATKKNLSAPHVNAPVQDWIDYACALESAIDSVDSTPETLTMLAVMPTGDWCVVSGEDDVDFVTVGAEDLARLATGQYKDGNELIRAVKGGSR